jgi:hypothetical protein
MKGANGCFGDFLRRFAAQVTDFVLKSISPLLISPFTLLGGEP